jgi:hypothetical protein
LALAATEGRLILTLRGWTDESAVPTEGAIASSLLGETIPRTPDPTPADKETRAAEGTGTSATPAPRARSAATTARPAAQGQGADGRASAHGRGNTVEILRGDQFEQRRFDGTN